MIENLKKYNKKIGKNLKIARVTRGVTQVKMGEILGGISFQQIQKYESGNNRLSAASLVAICKTLDISYSEILPDLSIDDDTSVEKEYNKTEQVNDVRLLNSFKKIKKKSTKSAIRKLVAAISKEE